MRRRPSNTGRDTGGESGWPQWRREKQSEPGQVLQVERWPGLRDRLDIALFQLPSPSESMCDYSHFRVASTEAEDSSVSPPAYSGQGWPSVALQ